MPRFKIDLSSLAFQRDVKESLKKHRSVKEDLQEVFESLENELLGDQIPGLSVHVRKVRVGVKKAGIGKRKGYRLIFKVDGEKNVITPLCFHFKAHIELIGNKQIEKLLKDAVPGTTSDGPEHSGK